jgi:hypothetical protein
MVSRLFYITVLLCIRGTAKMCVIIAIKNDFHHVRQNSQRLYLYSFNRMHSLEHFCCSALYLIPYTLYLIPYTLYLIPLIEGLDLLPTPVALRSYTGVSFLEVVNHGALQLIDRYRGREYFAGGWVLIGFHAR